MKSEWVNSVCMLLYSFYISFKKIPKSTYGNFLLRTKTTQKLFEFRIQKQTNFKSAFENDISLEIN